MKLFKLEKRSDRHKNFVIDKDGREIDPWDDPYGCMHSLVVRAENEERARKIASNHAGDEDWVIRYGEHYDGVWTNPDLTSCKQLQKEGEEGVINRYYRHG